MLRTIPGIFPSPAFLGVFFSLLAGQVHSQGNVTITGVGIGSRALLRYPPGSTTCNGTRVAGIYIDSGPGSRFIRSSSATGSTASGGGVAANFGNGGMMQIVPTSQTPPWRDAKLTPAQAVAIDSLNRIWRMQDQPKIEQFRQAMEAGDSATMDSLRILGRAIMIYRDSTMRALLTPVQIVIVDSVKAEEQRRISEIRRADSVRRANMPPQPPRGPSRLPRIASASEKLPYPDELRSAGLTGTVRASYVIESNGRVNPNTIIIVSSTHTAFTQAVCVAVPRLVYEPALNLGQPIRAVHNQVFTFTPSNK